MATANAAYGLIQIWLRGEKRATAVHYVRRDDQEFRDLNEILNALPAIIEFMIAEGGRVEAGRFAI